MPLQGSLSQTCHRKSKVIGLTVISLHDLGIVKVCHNCGQVNNQVRVRRRWGDWPNGEDMRPTSPMGPESYKPAYLLLPSCPHRCRPPEGQPRCCQWPLTLSIGSTLVGNSVCRDGVMKC